MRRFFLGMGAGRRIGALRQLFTRGTEKDAEKLSEWFEKKFRGRAILCKNGRSGLALALKAYLRKGDRVAVNGFTCFAVVEAVKAAGMTPVYLDISRENLNFSAEALLEADVQGVIVQNTLGNMVEMERIEKVAKKKGLVIIEDLAHSAGRKYPDGREAGTVGAAAVWSFGKEKAVDTTSGGAVVLRDPCKNEMGAPFIFPKGKDSFRARVYPVLVGMCRGLTSVKIGGILMKMFLRFHWIEKSADNRLNLEMKITNWQAKLALGELAGPAAFSSPKKLKINFSGAPSNASPANSPLRDFYLVKDREKVLKELKGAGYYFEGFWYEKPVSPERYYRRAKFPEGECPVATEVAKEIINVPRYYSREELAEARKIIRKYEIREGA